MSSLIQAANSAGKVNCSNLVPGGGRHLTNTEWDISRVFSQVMLPALGEMGTLRGPEVLWKGDARADLGVQGLIVGGWGEMLVSDGQQKVDLSRKGFRL